MQSSYFNLDKSDLNQLDAYQIYCSVKLHFTQKKYDFTRMGQIKKTFTPESLNQRPDAIFFKKLSEEYLYKERYIPLVVSNIFENTSTWSKDLLDEQSKSLGMKYRAYLKNPEEYFNTEIKNLVLASDIFTIKDLYSQNTKKNYFGLQTSKKISPLTASILNNLFYTKYLANTSLSFVYSDKATKLEKLHKFIEYDKISNIDESYIMKLIKDIQ